MDQLTYYTLNNTVKIPKIGFGTWQTPSGSITEKSVLNAIQCGYRLIDTAAIYGNEVSVGHAIKQSGINRSDLFVTTKLWNADHGYRRTKLAIDKSLMALNLDYLDLYLIHWPNPVKLRDRWAETNAASWLAMEEAVESGKIRAIGVSNFRKNHFDELFKTAVIKPAVNQIFINPSDLQPKVTNYNKSHGILTEAYSPLGTGNLFNIPELKQLAAEYNRSIAQIALKWSLQHGFLPLPKSIHRDRIATNIKLFDFEISKKDMETIDSLEGRAGLAQDPDQRNL